MDYMYDDLDDEGGREKRMIIGDYHLQSPIRPDTRYYFGIGLGIPFDNKFIKKYDRSFYKLPVFIRELLTSLKKSYPLLHNNPGQIILDSEVLYGTLLSMAYNPDIDILNWVNNNVDTVHASIFEVMQEYDVHMKSSFKRNHVSELMKKCSSIKTIWEDIKECMLYLSKKSNNDWKIINFKGPIFEYVIYSRSMLIIPSDKNIGDLRTNTIHYNDRFYLLDYEQVLMISDTISSRCLVMMYLDISSDSLDYLPSVKSTIDLYKIFDDLLSKKGNDAYSQIKTFESVCYSLIMKKTDKTELYLRFQDCIMNEAREEGMVHVEKVYSLLEGLTCHQICELHGLYRHWGHPTVNEKKGCEKVRKIAHTPRVFKSSTNIKILGCLKKQFCISFLIKHNRWPKCDTSKLPKNSLLRVCIQNQTRCINLCNDNITLEEWANIKIHNELIFDYHVDFTDLIDDKALAVATNYIHTLYDPSVTNNSNKNKPSASRRVLCEILRRHNIDIEELCTLIRLGMLPKTLYIILLSSKEREIKTDPRLFAMMVLELRLYFCITEKNIAEKVFPYYPQQSMTSNEEKLLKRLYKISNTKEKIGILIILIGIDFKSWNIHWTYESTYLAFEMLDELFGISNLYKCTHDIFRKCLIALASRLYPDPSLVTFGNKSDEEKFIYNHVSEDDMNTMWEDHEGGFEGIRQKGWTLITIGILLLVEMITGLKSSIIGQGDNQVVKLEIPFPLSEYKNKDVYIEMNQKEIAEKVDKFMSTLDKIVKDIGLEIKLQESWASDGVMAYGKDIIIHGALVSQSLKRVSRGLPDTNQLYPTLHTKISTLQTAGLSAAQKTYHIYPLYYMSQYETLLLWIKDVESVLKNQVYKKQLMSYFYQRKITSINQIKDLIYDKPFYKFILYGYTDIFGLPVSNLNDYLYRGHPDPLTGYLSSIEDISDPIARRIYKWLEENKYKLGDGNIELLYMNPSSLNISCVNPINSIFKKSMKEFLKVNTKNINLKEIFNTSFENMTTTIYSYMAQCKPQYPRVFHELIQATYIATYTNFISKFHNSKTLQQIKLVGGRERNFFDLLDKSNLDVIVDLIEKFLSISNIPVQDKSQCSTELADQLRNYTWSIALKEEKIEGVTVPHPNHQFEFIPNPILKYSEQDSEYISALIQQDLSISDLSKIGNQPPFIGSRTHEKKSGRLMVVPTANRPLQAALRIEQLRTWCFNLDDDINIFLDRIIESRTNIDKEIVALSSGRIFSGSISHRLNDHDSNKSTLNNMRSNITTYVLLSTDKMGDFSKGSDNYNIHFQGAIHLLMRKINNEIISQHKTTSHYYHLKLSHKHCLKKYSDDKISGYGDIPVIPTLSNNPLVFSGIINDDIYQLPTTDFLKITQHNSSDWAAAAHLFSKFSSSIENQIWEKGETHAPIVSSLSLQDIVKIGLSNIINKLSIYLILYFEVVKENGMSILNNLPRDIWGSIPDFCLHQDIYKELMRLLHLDGIAGLHERGYVLINKLNGYLIRSVRNNLKKLSMDPQLISKVIYFNSTGIPMSTIIRMWSFSNHLLNKYSVSVHKSICKLLQHNCTSYMVSQKIFSMISKVLIHNPGAGIGNILISNPILLSRTPPEAHLRSNIIQKYTPLYDTDLAHLYMTNDSILCKIRKLKLINNYPEITNIMVNSTQEANYQNININNINIPKSVTYMTQKDKRDHLYRTANNISTAYLKYLEIIIREKITFEHQCLCTADGEGSVSYICHKLSRKTVIYNSLCNQSTLIPHRFESYLPGSFLSSPESIIGPHLCMRDGGDLTDDRHIERLLELIPADISLLTMDAEVSGAFNPLVALKICRSIQYIISVRSVYHIIYKTFTNCKRTLLNIVASFEPYYNTIKLIIPTYSSYEGTECFIYCTHRKDHMIEIPKDGCLIQDISYERYSETVYNFGRLDNLKIPFQEINKDTAVKLLNTSILFGFHCNFSNSLSRYIMDNSIISHESKTENLFNETIMDCYKQISVILLSFLKTSTGKGIAAESQVLMLGKRIIHKPIDRFCLTLLNIRVLLSSVVSEYTDDVIEIVDKELTKGIYIYKDHLQDYTHQNITTLKASGLFIKNKKILYKYNVPSIKSWKVEFLKYFWKIYGHMKDDDLCIETTRERMYKGH